MMGYARWFVVLIFSVNFIIGMMASFSVLGNTQWELMGSLETPMKSFVVYVFVLNICSLAVVCWVALDCKYIDALDYRIRRLEGGSA